MISSTIQNLRDWDRVIQISILICQEPRRRMLPHAWLFYFDPYWGWRTPFWTKLWVPRSGKDLAKNKGLSPLAIVSGLFNFPPPLSLKSKNIYLHSSRAKAKNVTSRLAFLFWPLLGMADPFLDQIIGSAVWEGSGKQGAVPYGNFQWTFQFSTSSIPKMSLFLTATLWGRSY